MEIENEAPIKILPGLFNHNDKIPNHVPAYILLVIVQIEFFITA